MYDVIDINGYLFHKKLDLIINVIISFFRLKKNIAKFTLIKSKCIYLKMYYTYFNNIHISLYNVTVNVS